jgi:hypothetical protein
MKQNVLKRENLNGKPKESGNSTNFGNESFVGVQGFAEFFNF